MHPEANVIYLNINHLSKSSAVDLPIETLLGILQVWISPLRAIRKSLFCFKQANNLLVSSSPKM
jgi:hypothetical protein